jgi:hypothetical protein
MGLEVFANLGTVAYVNDGFQFALTCLHQIQEHLLNLPD